MPSLLLNKLHDQKHQITAIAHKYGARDIKVFGSVARGEENENSDVDILVSMQRGYDMFKQRIPMQEELEILIGKTVDLVVKHEVNQHLKAIILKDVRDL